MTDKHFKEAMTELKKSSSKIDDINKNFNEVMGELKKANSTLDRIIENIDGVKGQLVSLQYLFPLIIFGGLAIGIPLVMFLSAFFG